MLKTTTGILAAAILSGLAASGCATPTVAITHKLPAAVPVLNLPAKVSAENFAPRADASPSLARLAAKLVIERMPAAIGPAKAGESAGANLFTVGGTVRVKAHDVKGRRLLRVLDRASGKLRAEQLPSLVRTADLEADFVVRRRGSDQPIVTIETRRRYNSATDPAVRGELGLRRPDDPALVPPLDKVCQRMLAECVDEFWAMLTPSEINLRVRLRPVPGPQARAGFQAVRQGRIDAAVEQFEAAALARANQPDTLYDLAVLREAAGKLPQALANYRKVVSLTDHGDKQAVSAAKRVKLVMAQQAVKVNETKVANEMANEVANEVANKAVTAGENHSQSPVPPEAK